MSESSEVSAPPSALHALHESVEAEFQPYGPVQIVSTFGQPEAEYSAVHKSVGLIDEPQRGILEVSGADRFAFLNNLLTNQTWDKASKTGIAAGKGVYAFFLNTKGRIVSDIHAIELGDRMLLEMDVRNVEPIRSAFDKFLFREKVTMTNRVGSLLTISLHGPGTIKLLEELGAQVGDLPQLGSISTKLVGADAVVWRDDICAVPGFHIVLESAAVKEVWTQLLSRYYENQELGRRRLRPIGWAAYNACRIEGGRPIFGIDFDDSVLPAETGQMTRAVSLTKGCYLGQEIVARMAARNQVPRQLVGIRLAGDTLPIASAQVQDEQRNQIGGITSSTISPVLSNAAICLGYVKKPWFELGTVVNVPAEGAIHRAVVTELPFLNPSTAPVAS